MPLDNRQDRTLVSGVRVLDTVRTSGMPDGVFTHPDTPLLFEGETVTLTKAQVAYLGPKVKVGAGVPTRDDYVAYGERNLYVRQASPYPHEYYEGKSVGTAPDANFIQARLAETVVEHTLRQPESPTGHQADSPDLYENVPLTHQNDTLADSRIVKDVTDPV